MLRGVCIIVLLGTASQHFSMLGIPLRGTFITLGESQIIEKSQEKSMFIDVQKSLFYLGFIVFQVSKTILRGWKQGRPPKYTM